MSHGFTRGKCPTYVGVLLKKLTITHFVDLISHLKKRKRGGRKYSENKNIRNSNSNNIQNSQDKLHLYYALETHHQEEVRI